MTRDYERQPNDKPGALRRLVRLSWGQYLLLRLTLLRTILEFEGIDIALAISFWGVVLLAWPLFLVWFWPYIRQGAIEWVWVRIAIAATLFIIACALYFLRKYRRTLYGSAEVVIGFTTCIGVLSKSESSGLTTGVALAGAVYVMVRGMDNLFEGRKARKEGLQEQEKERSIIDRAYDRLAASLEPRPVRDTNFPRSLASLKVPTGWIVRDAAPRVIPPNIFGKPAAKVQDGETSPHPSTEDIDSKITPDSILKAYLKFDRNFFTLPVSTRKDQTLEYSGPTKYASSAAQALGIDSATVIVVRCKYDPSQVPALGSYVWKTHKGQNGSVEINVGLRLTAGDADQRDNSAWPLIQFNDGKLAGFSYSGVLTGDDGVLYELSIDGTQWVVRVFGAEQSPIAAGYIRTKESA